MLNFLRAPDVPVAKVVAPVRVAFLTNMLLQHDVIALEALAPLVGHLRIFVSSALEPDRKQTVFWGDLDVWQQRSLRWNLSFRNKHGYRDFSYVQVPLDQLWQLLRYKPDVIVANQLGLRTLLAVLYCRLRPATRLIVWATLSQRTEAVRGRLRLFLRKFILRHADACFVHGGDGEDYVRLLGYQGTVVHTPYVLDPHLFKGSSRVPDDHVLRLLYTGAFAERKGVVPFTEALCGWCRQHPERQVLFRLAGAGPELERLRAIELPPNLHVEFLGFLNTAALLEAYREASLYVLPSLGDEWALVINEALCMGVPVLGSRHAQAAVELVTEGETGWLFDPESGADTQRGLQLALGTSRARLRQMSANARSYMEALTPAATARTRAEAIRDVSENRPPVGPNPGSKGG